MTPPAAPARDKTHRFPGERISHGVGLYDRFPLSYRDVPELLFEGGIDVTHAAIRQGCLQCGQADAKQRQRRRAQPGDQGPLAAGFLTSTGARHSGWRAVAQDDHGLDMLGQRRRHKHAAQKCLRTLRKGVQDVPRGIIPAKLKRDGAAQRESRPGGAHSQSRSLPNRCEHAPRPTRQRAYRRQGLKAAGHAPRLLSASGPMAQHCRPRRHL